MSLRKVGVILKSRSTMEGAGVPLHRVFGGNVRNTFDPFLLLDDFSAEDPQNLKAGFPWHPHRGIETITYMISGSVQHEDSLGNKGNICDGDVQWMTAGSGIEHQEMPDYLEKGKNIQGFQLWTNLPKSHKMMDPRYRDITTDQIPCEEAATGVTARIIAGEINGIKGPVQDVITKPIYMDISMDESSVFEYFVPEENTVIVYIFKGKAKFGTNEKEVEKGHLVELLAGDTIRIKTEDTNARLLFLSGKPIKEPVAWYGPIVMNTQEEIETAFREYRNGTFIKNQKKI